MRMPPQRVLLGAGAIEAFFRGPRDGGHLADTFLDTALVRRFEAAH